MEKSTVLLRAIRKVTGQIATLKTVEIDRQIWRITTYQNRNRRADISAEARSRVGKPGTVIDEWLEAHRGQLWELKLQVVRGPTHFCKFYLLELNQVFIVSIRRKSSNASSRGKKNWTILKYSRIFFFLTRPALERNCFTRAQPTGVLSEPNWSGWRESTLAWKILWTEEPGRLHPWGHKESDMTERLHFHFSLLCIGEGNGNPLECSCLENPRDGVAQSWTRLKWLSSSNLSGWREMANSSSQWPSRPT